MNKNLNFQYMLDSKEFYSWIRYGQAKKKGEGKKGKGRGQRERERDHTKNKSEKCSRHFSRRPVFNSLDNPLTIYFK